MSKSKKKSKLKSFDENAGMHLNKFKIIVLILASVVVAIFFLVRSVPIFSVKTIEVRGNKIVSKDTIIDLCGIDYDSNLYGINKNYSISMIKSNAYIESVTISQNLPSTVVIEVEERKPLFVIKIDSGFVHFDVHGNIIDISENSGNLPIAVGFSTDLSNPKTGNKLQNEDVEKLNLVYKIIEIAKSKNINQFISDIDVSDSNNCKIILITEGKIAYVGDCSQLDIRMDYLKAIMEQETGNSGSIFINMDLNTGRAYFREEEI